MTQSRVESSYIGRHAELYDLFYAEKDYEAEAQFVHKCIKRYGAGDSGRLLELACGTGNHAFAMETFGYKVLATDYSVDMLAQARNKAKTRASRVEFRQQDMRFLNLSEAPFDTVMCLFDSIGYVASNENIFKVLESVRAYLKPGGLFIFEFWHAPAMLKSYSPLRVRRWYQTDREVLRISETELDYALQLAHVKYTMYELLSNNTYQTFTESQTNRYFLLQEMRAMITASGLEPIKAFNGFSEDESITDEVWHVVMIARRGRDNERIAE